jgi:8-oxo-dGTP pyrophosphatase MutT (NUDIX family)
MLIHRGPWSCAQLSATLVASTFTPDTATSARVAIAWEQARARLGARLFDGPVCRVEAIHAHPARLELALSTTSYRWFLGTNGTDSRLTPRADALGTCAVVLTSDQWLVCGRRSPQVALYPGYAHPFGGMVEPAETIDLGADMLRELQEELGLAPTDVHALTCLGMGVDPHLQQPELLFLAEVRQTRDELERSLGAAEHSALWSVAATRTAVTTAIAAGGLTPVAALALPEVAAFLSQ